MCEGNRDDSRLKQRENKDYIFKSSLGLNEKIVREISEQKHEPEWMADVLIAKDRSMAAPTFSPDGLYLAKIAYPEQFHIPGPWLANSWLPKDLIAL